MTDLGREIEAAVQVEWSPERLEAVRAGIAPRRRRRTMSRIALGATSAIALIVGGWLWHARTTGSLPRVATEVVPIAPPAPAPAPTLRFADGSSATAIGKDSRLRNALVASDRIAIELEQGASKFEVADDHGRVFEVASGDVTIASYGATFGCTKLDGKTQVEVYRGTLRVAWDGQQRELHAGDRGVFPPPVAPSPPPATHPAHPRVSVPPHDDRWLELAHDGDYDRAYELLDKTAVRDAPEDLLLEADVERLSHHPAEAVAPLREVIAKHASDPRASLAAFTLGRVLLEELGRPAEAASAFADAVRLAPEGPMAEDAIAREVEALSRAGETAAAKQLAEQYVQQFPNGRKLKSVRRFGAIE